MHHFFMTAPRPPHHRARRGAVRRAILTLLAEGPRHGYELIRELEDRSEGRWRPSPGSIYPTLHRMEANGVLASTEVDGKRQFSLTDRGKQRLEELRKAHADGPEPWADAAPGRRGELRRQMSELQGQVRQIAQFGTPDQRARAVATLETAKRELYAVLATFAGDEPDAGDES